MTDTSRRFQGSADSGSAGRTASVAGKPQLTEQDLKTMTPEQIEQARVDGRLDQLLGRI
jgi:hypothetical protein